MKVVHITNGYNHGGAAIACKRLVEAQRIAEIDATILTQERGNFPNYVTSVTKNILAEKLNFLRLAWEKFVYLFYQSSGSLRFQYSIANTGIDISNHKQVKEADIIHLHWINAGFISLKGLKKLMKLNKPVVWTLHDIWPLTGGCHIVAHCENYKSECIDCYFLKSSNLRLSLKQQDIKIDVYANQIQFVAPSKWQLDRATASRIFGKNKVINIPNAIEINKYRLIKVESRKLLNLHPNRKIILFGEFNIQAEHKGMNYLLEALENIPSNEEIELVIFGKKSELFDQLSFKVNYLGYISNEKEMMQAYCAADIFVSPSIEDNLPNTILESFSVGTPVVAFKTGGIPDIVDHKENGYLAEYKNAGDLASGIEWCLEDKNAEWLSANAIQKIDRVFSPEKVAKQFVDFYQRILKADEAKN